MTSSMDARLAEALEHQAVTRLQCAYGDVVTRRAWSELSELFRPDTVVLVDTRRGDPMVFTGGPAVGEFIDRSIERFEHFEFAMLNQVAIVDDDLLGASGRVYIWEIRQERDSGRWTNAFGVYQDRYVRDGDRWWYASRRYNSLARTAPDMVVFPFPDLGEI
jgi:hypothetical protein